MSDLPFVSVIVLSHRFNMALDAMQSVKRQSYPQQRLDLLLKHNEGPYYPDKFNAACAAAEGTYLVFLPDDDWLGEEFVTRHVAVAEATGAQMVYSDFLVDARLHLKWHLPPFTPESLRKWCVPYMTFLVRADFWREIGGWDGAQAYSDWDADIRMLQAGGRVTHLTKEFLWTRREHPLSGSSLMDTATHDAALAQLRAKHAAFFAGEIDADRRMPPDRGIGWRPL